MAIHNDPSTLGGGTTLTSWTTNDGGYLIELRYQTKNNNKYVWTRVSPKDGSMAYSCPVYIKWGTESSSTIGYYDHEGNPPFAGNDGSVTCSQAIYYPLTTAAKTGRYGYSELNSVSFTK
jgi:hypothetical protein